MLARIRNPAAAPTSRATTPTMTGAMVPPCAFRERPLGPFGDGAASVSGGRAWFGVYDVPSAPRVRMNLSVGGVGMLTVSAVSVNVGCPLGGLSGRWFVSQTLRRDTEAGKVQSAKPSAARTL